MARFICRQWLIVALLVVTSRALEVPAPLPSPLEVLDEDMVANHRLSTIHPVRVPPDIPVDFNSDVLLLETTVDDHGRVISAQLLPAESCKFRVKCIAVHPIVQQKLFPLVLAEAKSWKYKPFLRNGKPVPARFQELVDLASPESKPVIHVPFPPVRDWDSLVIVMERKREPTSYRVEIHGNGSVVYSARCGCPGASVVVLATGVDDCVGAPLITGEHHDHISRDAVFQLVEAFHRADFFSLRDKYSWIKEPLITVSIAYDAKGKSVGDGWGKYVGMPGAVTDLQEAIDDAAGIKKWTVGNAETVPSLMRERWDFKSAEAAKILVRAVGSRDFISVAADLIKAGVPADGSDVEGECTLFRAAQYGDEKLVDMLLRAGVGRRHRRCANRAMLMAAEQGKFQILRSLIEDGADVNFKGDKGYSFFRHETLLIAAAQSNNPEVVAEALKYHPDVNARDKMGNTALMFAGMRSDLEYETRDDKEADDREKPKIAAMLLKAGASPRMRDVLGRTPLYYASFPAVARLLIASGAEIEARDHEGATPLMISESPEVTTVLLQAGANPSATDTTEGHTALWLARAWLEDDINGRLGASVNHDRRSDIRQKIRILESWTFRSLSQNQNR